MTKRDMMNAYYTRVDMHSSELALKYGIADGSIKLDGDKITGKTFEAKDAIKAYFGARWNGAEKAWVITKNMEFAQLVFAEGLTV